MTVCRRLKEQMVAKCGAMRKDVVAVQDQSVKGGSGPARVSAFGLSKASVSQERRKIRKSVCRAKPISSSRWETTVNWTDTLHCEGLHCGGRTVIWMSEADAAGLGCSARRVAE